MHICVVMKKTSMVGYKMFKPTRLLQKVTWRLQFCKPQATNIELEKPSQLEHYVPGHRDFVLKVEVAINGIVDMIQLDQNFEVAYNRPQFFQWRAFRLRSRCEQNSQFRCSCNKVL